MPKYPHRGFRRGSISEEVAFGLFLVIVVLGFFVLMIGISTSKNMEVTVLTVTEHTYGVGIDGLTGRQIGTKTKIETIVATQDGKRYVVTGPRFAKENEKIVLDLKGDNVKEIGH